VIYNIETATDKSYYKAMGIRVKKRGAAPANYCKTAQPHTARLPYDANRAVGGCWLPLESSIHGPSFDSVEP